ncbi:histidine phosphatase family protein [Hydrogenophaga sp. 5NK40-0174]|uniref:histidine phosphatase family protein n=1 Tax=Hydrogenophaga sp. 5NK40-0174 TaxID=3127649 RepID=UPI00310AC9A4
MSIVLVRHGETALNAARVFQPPETPLSDLGRQQAQAVGRRLARSGAVGLIASDLTRAWETAAAVAEHSGLRAQALASLHERNFGDWRGQPHAMVGENALSIADAPPGGESQSEFEQRVLVSFRELLALKEAMEGDMIVVTHGLWIRTLLDNLPQSSRPDGGAPSIGNTAVTVLDSQTPHTVQLLNCQRHLQTAD